LAQEGRRPKANPPESPALQTRRNADIEPHVARATAVAATPDHQYEAIVAIAATFLFCQCVGSLLEEQLPERALHCAKRDAEDGVSATPARCPQNSAGR
jgi:hypothetical protein